MPIIHTHTKKVKSNKTLRQHNLWDKKKASTLHKQEVSNFGYQTVWMDPPLPSQILPNLTPFHGIRGCSIKKHHQNEKTYLLLNFELWS